MTPDKSRPEGEGATLIGTLHEVSGAIDKLRFWFLIALLPTIASLAAMVVTVVALLQLQDVAETNKATLGAIKNATSDEAKATNKTNLDTLVVSLLAEGACEMRRAIAGLPAADPDHCRAATGPDVYPGIVSPPLRPLGGG